MRRDDPPKYKSPKPNFWPGSTVRPEKTQHEDENNYTYYFSKRAYTNFL